MPVGTEASREPAGARVQIGAWTVEPALDRISSAASIVKLEPKAMSVLVFLADRAGEVVSRDALLAAVWPGVVVGDDSLTQVVIKLRKALGDAPESPSYIQTIAKKGYRLIAEVVRPAPAAPTTTLAQDPQAQCTTPAQSRQAQLATPAQSAQAQRTTLAQRAQVPHAVHVPWLAAMVIAALLLAAGIWGYQSGGVAGLHASKAPVASAQIATAQPTVGIKPFEVLGDDAQAALLAQGITADLVTDLSKVFGLWVIGVAPSYGQPGRQAGVEPQTTVSPIRYLVSGSVQRIEDVLRLQVHLTDMETGRQLWSERYDRAPGGFFTLQEELGRKILQTLPALVSEAELRRVARRYTGNLEAYEYFQRGQTALLARQKEENETARKMFRNAIGLDASFARAYAGLALTYAADYRNQWTPDGASALDRAFELATTAYQMDPDIAETYWVLAFVHMERRQHAQALQYLASAVQLYPSFADGYALMGGVKTYVGRPAETVPLLRTAMRLNAQAGSLYFLLLGRAYLFLGDTEQARFNLEQALARNPVDLEAHVYMAALGVAVGDKAAADWEAEQIRVLQPAFSIGRWLDTYPMTDAAQRSMLATALHSLGF
jgi:DNA-binding winged helix-turn-helix (wHTH) protein/TolB-like protein/Tfp pilus assembly protein PilF